MNAEDFTPPGARRYEWNALFNMEPTPKEWSDAISTTGGAFYPSVSGRVWIADWELAVAFIRTHSCAPRSAVTRRLNFLRAAYAAYLLSRS